MFNRIEVKDLLKNALRTKFANHNPEPCSMPFHTRLLGKDRLALYSFIHSLNTNFGTTIFEPIALKLGEERFIKKEKQFTPYKQISEQAQRVIQNIMDDLSSGNTLPAKTEEVERIRKVCRSGKMHNVKTTKVDLMFENKNGELYYIDLKSAKPNAGEFKGFKRTLLEWIAVTLANDPESKINTLIAIPYNPYAPEPYARWTIRGMLDLNEELKVADEFWDFLCGNGTYNELLRCFEEVGSEMREEIDTYFERFRSIF
ncbi:MAG: TdeIII family type II restriction endonuclease [Acetobacter sp.]|nr:TdeIII family type II restriction endonuclease [Acetobacter sp.]